MTMVYVVRYWTDKGSGSYLGDRGEYHCAQWRSSKVEALRFGSPADARAFVAAETRATGIDYTPFRIVRLVSRKEAVERARREARAAVRSYVEHTEPGKFSRLAMLQWLDRIDDTKEPRR